MFSQRLSRDYSFFFLLRLICACTFIAATVHATPLETEIKRIQDRYQHLSSLRFDFHQQTATSGRIRTGSGNAVFYRALTSNTAQPKDSPATIMRWNYVDPAVQIILNTGKELSIYTHEDKQLLITTTDQLEADITYALFSGNASILDTFHPSSAETVSATSPSKQPLTTLQLLPKEPHPQLQRLQIWYSPDYVIHKLTMVDHFDSTTTIALSNIRLDTIQPGDTKQLEAILQLDVPEDTEVIHQ